MKWAAGTTTIALIYCAASATQQPPVTVVRQNGRSTKEIATRLQCLRCVLTNSIPGLHWRLLTLIPLLLLTAIALCFYGSVVKLAGCILHFSATWKSSLLFALLMFIVFVL